ncbi:MAG: glycoside hydrolase family 2 [Clostridia bacterium]|nr:glycoside hydrolase family 2 [Clostridia bacterium]
MKNELFCRDNRVMGFEPTDQTQLAKRGYDCVPATVPGNLELDLFRAGKIPDPFFGLNQWNRECEYLHMYYVTSFRYDGGYQSPELHFEGIDTIADIYLNGQPVASTDNMLIPHTVPLGSALKVGKNELIVHIKPAVIEARRYRITPNDNSLGYNTESLYIRKAPHMYSWDIMPRFVSGGIWRPVYLCERKTDRILADDVFVFTSRADVKNRTAEIVLNYNVEVSADDISEYELGAYAVCGDSEISWRKRLQYTGKNQRIWVDNAKFWWPRNAGEPNLYDFTLTLYRNGEAIDTWEKKIGIRTVELKRTSVTDADGNGDFRFIVNGKPIFAMGTNWVPVDAFHSRDAERIPEIVPMLSDLGCNIIRIWGGNVYEDEKLYDYCDRDGIMVWQDFIMGCANYPQNREFVSRFEKEAEAAVKRLRNHCSIVLWAGDNENDLAYRWFGVTRDPNKVNILTRRVIPEVLERLDFSRPYLPSSPYVDDVAIANGWKNISEDHLWGPRDYFKGDYYRNTVCHFASETGYHGCPSPNSLKRYISPQKLWTAENSVDWSGINNDEWLCHATAQETDPKADYVYRIRLMADQVTTLFGASVPCTLEDFAKASQISQAEAKKYFIERFRLSKWRRTGIIWWNLIDGWPQISDAIVDYYYVKKLAYGYIKRSQMPLCLMCDEPDNGKLPLYAVNDGDKAKTFTYKVIEIASGEVVASGKYTVSPDASERIADIPIAENEKKFYFIEWSCGNENGSNHFMTNIKDIDYVTYIGYIRDCGYEEWEGFEKG